MLVSCSVCCFFFFQAEDGIRDLVRSRGLGDVYKRQVHQRRSTLRMRKLAHTDELTAAPNRRAVLNRLAAVSYTHLTLPTSDLV